jgi:hypothetical protein
MTEKQKQAILILNRLHQQFKISIFNDEDYFLLMDFVVGQHAESKPIHPWETDPVLYPWTRRLTEDAQPLDPVYGYYGKVNCNQNEEK